MNDEFTGARYVDWYAPPRDRECVNCGVRIPEQEWIVHWGYCERCFWKDCGLARGIPMSSGGGL